MYVSKQAIFNENSSFRAALGAIGTAGLYHVSFPGEGPVGFPGPVPVLRHCQTVVARAHPQCQVHVLLLYHSWSVFSSFCVFRGKIKKAGLSKNSLS